MKPSDSDTLLNQLIVAALTVFIVVILLFAAVIVRQIWLQQRLTELSSDMQVSLEILEETTEDVQRELAEINSAPGTSQDTDALAEVTAALADVEDQLDAIEEDLSNVELVWNDTSAFDEESDAGAIQDEVDQVFTIFAILVGVAGITIALLLGAAVRVQQRTSYSDSRRPHELNSRNHEMRK